MDKKQIQKIIKEKQSTMLDICEAIANLPEGVRNAFLASLKDYKALSDRLDAEHFARWGEKRPKLTRVNNQAEVDAMQKTMMRGKE